MKQAGVQVACDAYVRSCVHPVGGDFILYDGFCLEAEVLLGGGAYDGIVREDHDACVAGAYSQLVLSADHTEGLDAADLGLLDLEVSGKDGAYAGE